MPDLTLKTTKFGLPIGSRFSNEIGWAAYQSILFLLNSIAKPTLHKTGFKLPTYVMLCNVRSIFFVK